MSQQFSATIKKIGINPCVDLPLSVSQAFDMRGYIPVRGLINRESFHINLVPIGEGRHRLFLNSDIRRRAGVDVGSRIQVHLEIDQSPKQEPVPGAFAYALENSPQARLVWDQLSPSRRKEILRYLNQAKREETLKKNIDKAIHLLMGDEESLGGIRLR
ncbi:YdeI/OmpD-associated family protein [Microbulbifer taiwanensis]|uniref:YdeI/OmpD-associated family protein n=2 Tax=Microbulbifer taiwanensis TaxID=986746 RepID=A0ABW1YUC6_9GAMM